MHTGQRLDLHAEAGPCVPAGEEHHTAGAPRVFIWSRGRASTEDLCERWTNSCGRRSRSVRSARVRRFTLITRELGLCPDWMREPQTETCTDLMIKIEMRCLQPQSDSPAASEFIKKKNAYFLVREWNFENALRASKYTFSDFFTCFLRDITLLCSAHFWLGYVWKTIRCQKYFL